MHQPRRYAVTRVTLCVLALLGAAPAAASVGDKAWGQCVWASDPVGAQRFIGMTPPTWQSGDDTPEMLLGLRLAALCGAPTADEKKVNRAPNFRMLSSSLKASRPKSETVPPATLPVVERCGNVAEQNGEASFFLMEIVRVEGATRTVTHRQYYTKHEGQRVKLPQDLRVMPPQGVRITTTCRAIQSDGTVGSG